MATWYFFIIIFSNGYANVLHLNNVDDVDDVVDVRGMRHLAVLDHSHKFTADNWTETKWGKLNSWLMHAQIIICFQFLPWKRDGLYDTAWLKRTDDLL